MCQPCHGKKKCVQLICNSKYKKTNQKETNETTTSLQAE